MIQLAQALCAWGTPDFEQVLAQELAQHAVQLPLQQGLSSSSAVTDAPITVMVHSADDIGGVIRVKAGIFYQGVIAGCSCADDPTPVSEINEYCVVQLDIDKASAAAAVALLAG